MNYLYCYKTLIMRDVNRDPSLSLYTACGMLTPCVPSWSMIGKCSAHSPPQPPHTGETYIFSRNWQHQTNKFKIKFSFTMHQDHLFSWQCSQWRFCVKNKVCIDSNSTEKLIFAKILTYSFVHLCIYVMSLVDWCWNQLLCIIKCFTPL